MNTELTEDQALDLLTDLLFGSIPSENGVERMKPLPKGDKLEAWRDRRIERAVDAYYDHDTSQATLHKIGRSLHDIRVRDVLIREIIVHGEGFEENILEYLTRVADAMHPDDAAPILTVCALVAWMEGTREPLMMQFMAGALRADPDYSLLTLLKVAALTGMPFPDWADAMKSLTYDNCRYGMED